MLASTRTGVNDSGSVDRSTACGSERTANTSIPSTTAASRALASGTTTALILCSRAASAAERDSAHRAHLPIQRKLAQKNILIELLAEERALAAQNRKRHRQIERRTFLANVGGRQIDGDALKRKLVAAIFQRGLDAFAAFLHGNVRQADNIEIAGLARADVHLDLHEVGVNAKHSGAVVF